jgi:hypothetical protein
MEPRKPKKKKPWRDSAPIDMFLSAVSVLVVVQLSLEVPEGLMNNPIYIYIYICKVSLGENTTNPGLNKRSKKHTVQSYNFTTSVNAWHLYPTTQKE